MRTRNRLNNLEAGLDHLSRRLNQLECAHPNSAVRYTEPFYNEWTTDPIFIKTCTLCEKKLGKVAKHTMIAENLAYYKELDRATIQVTKIADHEGPWKKETSK